MKLPTPNSTPEFITAGPDGALWFTEVGANQIGRIDPVTHAFVEFTGLAASSQPTGITAGPDRSVWFTEHASTSPVASLR